MISYCAWVFPQMNRHDLELLREAGYELIDVKPDTLADSGLHAAATELGMAVNCMSITFDDRDTLHSEDPRAVEAALDVVSPAAIEVLTSRGTQAARRALGDAALDPFRNHLAADPVFFHGPNKTPENRHA